MGVSDFKSYVGIPIEQLKNNAAYIQNWLERLRNDKRFIVHASAQAQKATDFILNVRNEEKELELADQSEEPNKNLYREEELKKTRETKKEKLPELEK